MSRFGLGLTFIFCWSGVFDIEAFAEVVQKDTLSRGSYYVEAVSSGTRRELEPPSYVRKIGRVWLGLDSRSRLELRHNDIRNPEVQSFNTPLLLRQRLFLGLANGLGPVRLAAEVEDARSVFGKYPLTNRDVNKVELIQVYMDISPIATTGTDAHGQLRPISLRAGRMAVDYLDRRMLSSTRWRNTTNNFLGVRTSIGAEHNDWQIELLVFKPIVRDMDRFDKTDLNRLFIATIGHWRKWSEQVTIEPFYMMLKDTPKEIVNARTVQSVGSRFYGVFGEKRFNYDIVGTLQFGEDKQLSHRAYAFTAETGYRMAENDWRPKVIGHFAYVSGDRDASDKQNNRFDRMFGAGHPWSVDDYIVMENIVVTKLRGEFQWKILEQPIKFDGGYAAYWLASERDRLSVLMGGGVLNHDPSGSSGSFVGQSVDVRSQVKLPNFLEITLGYSRFFHGQFVQQRQKAVTGKSGIYSNFVYLELSINVLK